MFWNESFDADALSRGCQQLWGVQPRRLWATQEWGGRKIGTHSNIVFSNGLLDPWHRGGVLRSSTDSIAALIIPEVRPSYGEERFSPPFWCVEH